MKIFLYFPESVGTGLDEIEDAIDEALLGKGEVTGSGIGKSGSNIDIEVTDTASKSDELLSLIKALSKFDIPQSSKARIQGQDYDLLL